MSSPNISATDLKQPQGYEQPPLNQHPSQQPGYPPQHYAQQPPAYGGPSTAAPEVEKHRGVSVGGATVGALAGHLLGGTGILGTVAAGAAGSYTANKLKDRKEKKKQQKAEVS